MPVILPFTISAGQPITANPLQSNFATLAGKFNASIVGTDISPNANIPGTVIASASLPATAIVPNSITATQIGAGVITSAQIASSPGTIASANIAGNTILWGNLKTNVFNWTLPSLGNESSGNPFAAITTTLTSAAIQPVGLTLVTSTDPLGASAALTISYNVYLNTSTGIYWLTAQNVGPASFVPGGAYILRLAYINLS